MRFGVRLIISFIFIFGLTFSCQRTGLYSSQTPFEEYVGTKEYQSILQNLAQNEIHALDSILERYHKYNSFHGNVLINYKGLPIYEGSVGYADPRDQTELTPEHQFQLASVSKQFTAMAIMILKEAGKVNYDDKVRQYIPELPWDNMTVRQLLNHTSGLPNYMWLTDNKWALDRAPDNEEVIDLIYRYKPNLYYTPGSRFYYSNTGYMLLASIVERVSGQKFADFVHENIFEPLGMKHSFVFSASTDTLDYEISVHGFRKVWKYYREIPVTVNDGAVGDKGVYSTTYDMYLWDEALYHNKIVSAQTQREAFIPGKTRWNRDVPYGFGFRLKQKNGQKIVYHNGLWSGFRTSFIRNVEDSITVVLLSHTNNSAKKYVQNSVENYINKEHSFDIVYQTIKMALKKSPQAAIEYLVAQDNPDLDLTKLPAQIMLAADQLRSMNKPRTANKLDGLASDISVLAGLGDPEEQGVALK